MDESVIRLANQLAHTSPEATTLLKHTLWKGTEHWDQLLLERAAMSGRLILSPSARQALEKMKGGR